MNRAASAEAEMIYPASNLLGEGPVWHAGRKSLFWVDIEGKAFFEMSWPAGKVSSRKMPQRVGAVIPDHNNGLIVAMQDGLVGFDLKSGLYDWLAGIEEDISNNRPNDGKCDPAGRLWLGTMDMECRDKAGSLYCIEGNLSVTKKLSQLTISNGMAWSPDHERFYYIDSVTFKVDSYLFDLSSGNIVFEKTVISVPAGMGMPDGMTIDEEGMLWIAHWDGYAVRRWDPHTGHLLDTIHVPARQVTSCTFGGDQLDQLFITTAKTGLSEEELAEYPLSGHVFAFRSYVKGMGTHIFGDPF